jgi:hypothetical protein
MTSAGGLPGALLVASSGEFLGLFETVAVGFDVDDLGAVDEAVDEGDDAAACGNTSLHSAKPLLVLSM